VSDTWDTLLCELREDVTVVTLNRPDRLNTMNLRMREELWECLTGIREAGEARAVIVTGAGEAFCAGGDMNDFVSRSPEEMHLLMRERSHRWFRALWDLPTPTVAALNGVAAGGGANLVLACDFVVASERATIGETFLKVGLMPDLGGLFLLPRTVGLHRAKALCLTGELIDARRAHELGLVHEVTSDEQLMPRALSLGRQLAASPAPAYAATKALLNRSFELSMDEVLQQELFAQSFLFSTGAHRARLDSFLSPDRDDPPPANGG
jgi:2-(1,2-epoxy-1,2-dihydrophenyl)acetyl-CoA isomerase